MNKKTAISRINPLFLKGICHRGLHNDIYSENGMKAFENALQQNMAFELDVHLTLDGELVVFHDSDTKRMTGKDGILEKMDLKTIREQYRLPDGGVIPTLKEVFDFVQERVPIVVELKVYEKNYKPLAARVKKELECIKDKKNIMLISFDPRSLFPFKKSGYIRQLLVSSTYERTYFFRHFVEGVDLDQLMMREKRVQRYSKNHFVNVWTIETEEQYRKVLPCSDTVTFQFVSPIIILETQNGKHN